MAESVPRVELYTDTFLESSLVRDCVHDFYVSILRFWTQACKFYQRRRLWSIFSAAWGGYDAEFHILELEMDNTREQVDKAAVAQHLGESKLARTVQRSANQVLLQAGDSQRQKEITTWLAPIAYDANYFVRDQEAARALRHPNTCRWVLDKQGFQEWSTGAEPRGPLWIYAKPGAGKTILSSFLIDHYQFEKDAGEARKVFYFFCKDADADKNKPISVVRSLLYQLYSAQIPNHHSLATQLGNALGQIWSTKGNGVFNLLGAFLHACPRNTGSHYYC